MGKLAGSTLLGGLVGGVIATMSWGCVLFSVAGCAVGTYIVNKSRTAPISTKKNIETQKLSIDVDALMKVFKNICISIDELIDDYSTSVSNIKEEYANKQKLTLMSSYRVLVDAIAQLHTCKYNCSEEIPQEISESIDFIMKTLRNYHCEIIPFTIEHEDKYLIQESENIAKGELIKPAIMENGILLEKGEYVKPYNKL